MKSHLEDLLRQNLPNTTLKTSLTCDLLRSTEVQPTCDWKQSSHFQASTMVKTPKITKFLDFRPSYNTAKRKQRRISWCIKKPDFPLLCIQRVIETNKVNCTPRRWWPCRRTWIFLNFTQNFRQNSAEKTENFQTKREFKNFHNASTALR